jgi:hypothetical protein
MDLVRIATRIARGGTWFHTTNKSLFKPVLKDGLVLGSNPEKWGGFAPGKGVYLVNSMEGAIRYMDFLELSCDDAMIVEISPPGSLLMDEDDVAGAGNFDEIGHPEEPFAKNYPEAYAEIKKLVESGMDPNLAKITAIEKFSLEPDNRLVDYGQGGLGALTGRFPGSIPASNIKHIYFLDEDCEPFVAWPKENSSA